MESMGPGAGLCPCAADFGHTRKPRTRNTSEWRSAMWSLLFDRPGITTNKNLAGQRPFLETLEDRCSPSSIIDLGTLGGYNSYGLALNNAGVVVGNAYLNGFSGMGAFRYGSDTGTLTNLGTFGGTFAEARGINDAGQIVGGA